MPEDSLTPEERLLRLIRRKGSAPSASAEIHRPVTAKSLRLPRRPKPSLAHDGPWIPYDSVEDHTLFMRTQKILSVLIVLTILFLFGSRFLPRRQMSATTLLEAPPVSSEPQTQEPATPKPYEYYGKAIGQRDLFQPGLPSKEDRGQSPSATQSRFKDLALIGIISGKTPQAIIEDKKESKTYFLKEGELVGEMRVEQISDEKVTLGYEGEQFELVL